MRRNGGHFDNASEIILELHFGEGGEDSKNFVGELYEAYRKYAESLHFKIERIHEGDGQIIAKVCGKNVWKAFQHEIGKHCCQRVPETETKGRRHTSLISVGILPIKEDVWEPLKESELEVTAQTGKQGAGGQNVNKVASAIRMKHIPTGLCVFINGRDQGSNRREALKILTARVNDLRQSQLDKSYADFRRQQLGDGRRGSKIRTFNFIDSRVTDHQLGVKTSKIKEVMKGDFKILFDQLEE